MPEKKTVLLFGANSFIAQEFSKVYGDRYRLQPVTRRGDGGSLALDFSDPAAVGAFAAAIDFAVDGIVFFQGINPSQGLHEISEAHFTRMMQVNLITPTLLLQQLRPRLSDGCSVVFFSSVAKRKGSYDPSYAAAKSALTGLLHSYANALPACRFNTISLGLVENSPVYEGMTDDFRARHASRMQGNGYIQALHVAETIDLLLNNPNINRADIAVDGGYV